MCSPTSAPDPDTIPYSVWKSVHDFTPSIRMLLLSPLLCFGHHLVSLKNATGVVIDKPEKPSYNSLSFRIILLIQTVSKILERVMATPLSALARFVGHLHPNPCGSPPSLSLFNARALPLLTRYALSNAHAARFSRISLISRVVLTMLM